VVAAGRWLDDFGRALGLQAGEDHRRLDLRAHDVELDPATGETVAPYHEGRKLAVRASVDARPQCAQGADDASHRPPLERAVAAEHTQERAASEQAGEHAHRRARVAAVDHGVRLA
jgi:hypothetical protein